MHGIAAAAVFVLLMAGTSNAQTFEKRNYNYSEFAKGAFSEAVTVTGPAKFIYLAGVGSEDQKDGSIRHKGDFLAQCHYAWEKIGKVLAANGATVSDIEPGPSPSAMTSFSMSVCPRSRSGSQAHRRMGHRLQHCQAPFVAGLQDAGSLRRYTHRADTSAICSCPERQIADCRSASSGGNRGQMNLFKAGVGPKLAEPSATATWPVITQIFRSKGFEIGWR